MECTAVGTVAEEQLEDVRERLVGLSGLPGQEVHLQELVLKSGLPDRPDLHLQHSLPVGSDDSRGGSAGRWTAAQYRLPVEGRASADLAGTVRSMARSECSGPDVPGFWRALGFSLQYQLAKRGVRFEVEHGGHTIQVLVCRVLRVPPDGGQLPNGAGGEELVPGHWLVEATAAVEGGAYAEAAAALGSLSKLLSPYTRLQPLTKGRRAAG